jgi:hypothetical protein
MPRLIERCNATSVTDQQQRVELPRGSKKCRTAQAGLGR